MKNTTLLLLLAFVTSVGFSQCPTSDILLTNQADIDNFADNFPNCSMLTHELRIDGDNSDITNLNGLSLITSAEIIFIQKTQITDFMGLDNLVNIEHLSSWFNTGLQDFSGLNSLETVEHLELFINPNIQNFEGLPNIQSINTLSAFQNAALTDISQLSFLETMNELTIFGNSLTSLAGLENLTTIQGDLSISDEPLVNFDELANLQTIGGSLFIADNALAQNLSAFSNIEELVDLYVIGCPGLMNLSGLEGIQSISGTLRIGFNPGLEDLTIFSNITSVAFLDVYENENMISLKGLENLSTITNRLFIDSNDSLAGLNEINGVSPTELDEVVIMNNTVLSMCNTPLICAIIDDPAVSKTIVNNDNGCNSIQEVYDACFLSVSDIDLNASIQVFPNPVSDMLTIQVSNNIRFESASVYSILGELLLLDHDTNVDFSSFADGVYLIEIKTDKGNMIEKIVNN